MKKCNICNKKVNDMVKFCPYCGNLINDNDLAQNTHNNDAQTLDKTNLSQIALGFTIVHFASFLLYFLDIKLLQLLANIPWLLISLILSIISFCKHRDKLAKIILIINIVVIGVGILLTAMLLLFSLYFLTELINGCR